MRLLALDPRPGRPTRCLRFAADGRALAAVVGRPDDPRRRPVWYDLRTDAPAAAFPAEKAGRAAADPAFAPDPRLTAEVFAGPARATFVRLTDARGDRLERRRLDAGPGREFTAVAFSADGGTLFAGFTQEDSDWPDAGPDRGLAVVRLDVAAWLDAGDPDRLDDELPADDPTYATSFADTGGGLLAVGTATGTAVLYDLLSGAAVTVAHAPGATDPPPVDAVLLSPDGRHLVTRAAGTLAVWDALTGREVARPKVPEPAADCAFTPDGRSLLVAGPDGGVYRFDPPGYTPAGRLDFGQGPLHSVAVAPDGLVAAAGTGGGGVVLWDV